MAIIGYLRVSTKGQGESGLGLEGQQAAIEAFAKQRGEKILMTYTEVESGRRADRPQLLLALSHAKMSKATLVVAKLDRLSRNLAFLARVMESGCEFAAADMPAANRFMLHIMAAVAEHEAKVISDRTTAALQAYKSGQHVSKRIKAMYDGNVPKAVVQETAGKLGAELPQCRNLNPDATAKGRERSAAARARLAAEAYQHLLPRMIELRKAGWTLQAIANRLETDGHLTRNGKPWNPTQVGRVLARAQG